MSQRREIISGHIGVFLADTGKIQSRVKNIDSALF
jgi:hypothetical protein